MPLYKMFYKGKAEDFRLIKAPSIAKATNHFLGKTDIVTETVTDVLDAANLVGSGVKVEDAMSDTPALQANAGTAKYSETIKVTKDSFASGKAEDKE